MINFLIKKKMRKMIQNKQLKQLKMITMMIVNLMIATIKSKIVRMMHANQAKKLFKSKAKKT